MAIVYAVYKEMVRKVLEIDRAASIENCEAGYEKSKQKQIDKDKEKKGK